MKEFWESFIKAFIEFIFIIVTLIIMVSPVIIFMPIAICLNNVYWIFGFLNLFITIPLSMVVYEYFVD